MKRAQAKPPRKDAPWPGAQGRGASKRKGNRSNSCPPLGEKAAPHASHILSVPATQPPTSRRRV
eukprot:1270911-Rhodomonas_salina.1